MNIRSYSLDRIMNVKGLAALLIAFMLTPLIITFHAVLQQRYSQSVIEDHIFSEKGYRITSQQQSVKLDFRIDSAYIPKKQGDVFRLHKLIYSRNHTKIYLETVAWYNPPQNSDNIYVELKFDPTYLYGKGSFVTSAIINNDHSFGNVMFMPDYYADDGSVLPINDGGGRSEVFIPVEQLAELDGGLTLKFEGFNLVKYERA
ncbi:hypothetical protein [Paenibacillus glycanilyticus]|uniref:DUF4352 domain-containing protein n=1 Tax=Paenibacillus glycanilyticus TaxID=126569 RepID=A0ABQ6GI67_9BACL|nr:hypothetical protein [Paenibacillus glycanilyticus]GLX68752.1 hypothetical protein MU1_30970 [Paenibacillus glycanilyticus]